MLAKMCFATVTAEMATNLYAKVLSILQTKSRGQSASTSPPSNTKIKTVTTLTPPTLSELIACAVALLEKGNEADHPPSPSFPIIKNSIGISLSVHISSWYLHSDNIKRTHVQLCNTI